MLLTVVLGVMPNNVVMFIYQDAPVRNYTRFMLTEIIKARTRFVKQKLSN